MRPDTGKYARLQQEIFGWWKRHARDLPWRKTRDPYRILVSEVMLQQTQVSRVLPKFAEFLIRFPDVHALAAASAAEVLRVWKGMGYNRRALYLKRTAESVVREHDGVFPDSEAELVKLPGVGKYTARALMVFAYEQDVAMVDTNIRQIITHFFFGGRPQKENVIQEVADALVPAGKSWAWHQALMDYGALKLSRIKPKRPRGNPKVPFAKSNRFYRGKLMDWLRDGHMAHGDVIGRFRTRYGKDAEFAETVIAGLVSDGLLVRDSKMDILHLPE